MSGRTARVAIVGCGYVADLYMATLPHRAELRLVGATDRDAGRAARFAAHWRVPAYESLGQLLDDPSVEIVLNLTNPRSHFAVTEACLLAGKHVYSEKPLALSMVEVDRLVTLAGERGLYLSSAPSRVLGEPAQTMWKALRAGTIGRPLLAYAEMDDGLLHAMDFREWRSASGAPWPYVDELETGCTLEHAGYALTWLTAFFGPAERVVAYSALVAPDKRTAEVPVGALAPDVSIACVRYRSGLLARLTCSIVAPENHSITIVGDEGVLSTENCWKPRSPVHSERRVHDGRWVNAARRSRVEMLRDPALPAAARALETKVDFCLGPVELAAAIADRRPARLSARFCAHVAEIVLAIDAARNGVSDVAIESSFEAMTPMPWAR